MLELGWLDITAFLLDTATDYNAYRDPPYGIVPLAITMLQLDHTLPLEVGWSAYALDPRACFYLDLLPCRAHSNSVSGKSSRQRNNKRANEKRECQ